MIIERCPNCKASHVQTHNAWSGLSGRNVLPGNGRVMWHIHQCQNDKCNKLILIEKIDDKVTHLFPYGEFKLNAITPISKLIRDDFEEAGVCLSAGCFKASLVMSRRALQRCLKEQDCNQRNLVDAIDAAIKNGILRKSFHDLAEEIRQYGNLGAHPDDDQLENVNREAASQVLEFTKLLIHEFYEIPATAARLKANREKMT